MYLTATLYLYNNLFFILLQQKISLRQFLRMALVLICGASGICFTNLTFYQLIQQYIHPHPFIHIWNDYLSSMSCLIPAASRSNSQVCLYSQSETRGVMTRTRTHCDELPDHAFITEGIWWQHWQWMRECMTLLCPEERVGTLSSVACVTMYTHLMLQIHTHKIFTWLKLDKLHWGLTR